MAAGLTFKQGLPVTGTGADSSVTVTPTSQTTAFNELSVAERHPEFQISAQYDSLAQVRTVILGGTASAIEGQFTASSGTGANNIAAIFSDRQIISRMGQGSEAIFTALYTTGVADSRQTAGLSTASDAMMFGFEGVDFGVYYTHSGRVIIEELTVATPAGGAENATVTINGTGYTVPLTAGTVDHNASEIANSLNTQVPLYNFTQNEDTVVCRSILATPAVGVFTFTSSTAAATFSSISLGVEPTREFTAQADWNGGVTLSTALDPTLLNRYKIVFNGSIDYYIEDSATGSFKMVHRRVHTNTTTVPLFSVATFRLAWSTSNQGNTTNLTVSGSEASAFNQGEHHHLTGTRSRFHDTPSIGTTNTNILSIRTREVFGTKVNLGRLILREVGAFTDATKGAIVQICKGVTFTGETDWHYIDKEASIAEYEDSALPVTGGVCIRSFPVGVSAEKEHLEELILPGEVITIAMGVTSGGGTGSMDASMIWEEDI